MAQAEDQEGGGFSHEPPNSQMPSALFRRGADPYEYQTSLMEQERQEREEYRLKLIRKWSFLDWPRELRDTRTANITRCDSCCIHCSLPSLCVEARLTRATDDFLSAQRKKENKENKKMKK